jgi:hypothetical protein
MLNSTNINHDLTDVNNNENINLYTNINLENVTNIMKTILNNNNQIPKRKTELITMLNKTFEQTTYSFIINITNKRMV